jgi:protein-L-isoaspartate(D-aspartate) O-methyltransferase
MNLNFVSDGCKMIDFLSARTNMVDSQLRPNGITDSRILDAMQAIKREDFVPQSQRDIAYMDGDVPLKGAATPRYLIEPMAFAQMLQLAEIKSSDRVLDIGAATGYGAAVLSGIAAHVVAVESDANLIAAARINLQAKVNVTLIEKNLTDGAAQAGPFDLILIEGRVGNVPEGLFAQLTSTGRIIAAVGDRDMAKCCIWTIVGEGHTRRTAFDISIATLPGFEKPAVGFAF